MVLCRRRNVDDQDEKADGGQPFLFFHFFGVEANAELKLGLLR